MSKTIKISQLMREESKTISITIPASQYQIMDQLAGITHRTVNDLASQLFGDHTIPQIDAMLNPKPARVKKKTDPKKAANPTSSQTPLPVETATIQIPPPVEMPNPVSPGPINPRQITNQTGQSQIPASGSQFGSVSPQTPTQPRPIQPSTQPPSPTVVRPPMPIQPAAQPPLRPPIPPTLPTVKPENE